MAEYSIYNSQYTAQQINSSIGKNPVIDDGNGNWLTWDMDSMDYVDSGFPSRGQQGVKGDTGANFKILGMYATASDLRSAHPVGNAGDAYAVGTAEDNSVYIWDVNRSDWASVGKIQSDIFIATYGETTNAQIYDAYTSGKLVVAKNASNYPFTLVGCISSMATFTNVIGTTISTITVLFDSWSTKRESCAPIQHAEEHASDGYDPITPAMIGAASLDANGKVPLSQLPVYDGTVV